MDANNLPMRTMVVDDDHLMRCLLTDILEPTGMTVKTAASCKQALTLFEEYEPELIVCDCELPDAAGVELVRHIRYVEQDRRPFIMMVSAHRTNCAMECALQAGANDYLTKPIKKAELLARIANVQASRYLDQQLGCSDLMGHLTVSHGYYSLYAS